MTFMPIIPGVTEEGALESKQITSTGFVARFGRPLYVYIFKLLYYEIDGFLKVCTYL